MIKGKIHQEDITVITMYAPNMGTSKYIKQLADLKEGIDSNTITVEELDRSSTQKVNKEIMALSETLDQTVLIKICIVYSIQYNIIYIPLKYIWNFLKDRSYVETQVSINLTEIISSIFPNHNSMKLETNYKKKTGKKFQICGD